MSTERGHMSDCAVHNEPAYRNGPCSCGVGDGDAKVVLFRTIEPYAEEIHDLVAIRVLLPAEIDYEAMVQVLQGAGIRGPHGLASWEESMAIAREAFNAALGIGGDSNE